MNYVSKEDLQHFNEKGWVVIKNVLSPKYLKSDNFNEFFDSEKINSILNIFHHGSNWEWNINKDNSENVVKLVRNKVEENVKQNNFEWHIDGISFHHKLMSKDISLIVLPYLQCNNSKNSGQTVFKNGSHKYVSSLLKNIKDGVPYLVLSLISNIFTPSSLFPIEEIKIAAGDILISHPFTVHRRSLNYSDVPRICFRVTSKWKNEIKKKSPIGKIIYENSDENTDSIMLAMINYLINNSAFLLVHDFLLNFSKYIKP